MIRAAVIVAIVAALGCAVTRDGKCVDYQPMPMCLAGTYEECITTKDGCRQCSCVPAQADGRRPLLPGDP